MGVFSNGTLLVLVVYISTTNALLVALVIGLLVLVLAALKLYKKLKLTSSAVLVLLLVLGAAMTMYCMHDHDGAAPMMTCHDDYHDAPL